MLINEKKEIEKMFNNKKFFLAITIMSAVSVFTLSAIYDAGSNSASAQTEITSVSKPDAITNLIAIPENGQIHLSWSAPENNGSPIISYKIIRWETGSDVFTTFPNLSTNTEAIATGLKNNVSYSFKVIAINSIGESDDSNVASAKPLPVEQPTSDVPNAIADLIATRGDTKVNLAWTKPVDNGSPITSYRITYWDVNTGEVSKKTVDGSVTSAQITKLSNDVSYAFKINAVNAIGQAPDSNVDSATPTKSIITSVPNQVRGVTATPSNGQVFLTWIEPSDNGAPITSYRVIVNERGSAVTTTYPNIGDVTKTTITGLKNNVTYEFKINAVNSKGNGQASNLVSATPTINVPIAITDLRATAGDGKVKLSWSVTSNQLEDITGFRVREYKPGSDSFVTHSLVGKATSITIDGLTNGIPYGFRVLAVNSVGIGPQSNIAHVIPLSTATQIPATAKIPAIIGDLRATAGDTQVKLTWTAPYNNGFPITGYQITQSQVGSASFTTIPKYDTLPEAFVTGLINDASYTFKVSAINSEGTGKDSNPVSVVPKASNASAIKIPQWVKINAGWWAEGKISDTEYSQAIEYLINAKIIRIR